MEEIQKQEELLQNYFHVIDRRAEEVFRSFDGQHIFGDTTFSLLYAWQEHFAYAWRKAGDCIVVREHGLGDRYSCILIKKKNDRPFAVISELEHMFDETGLPLSFEYVREEDLDFYREAGERLGKNVIITSNEDDDDYIYEAEKFLSLEGKENKGKRGSMNWLLRQYPDVEVRFWDGCDRRLRDDSIAVFEKWCGRHDCEKCFYGCEKNAFLRFLDIFDASRHHLAVSYHGEQALSFAASEQVCDDVVCYYFQKNAACIRGLTYFLNREMMLQNHETGYINLGEDMGLAGLREDKTGLHPCMKRKKYSVELR